VLDRRVFILEVDEMVIRFTLPSRSGQMSRLLEEPFRQGNMSLWANEGLYQLGSITSRT
jgi:hypothetical protein